jgi:hypothetical protein
MQTIQLQVKDGYMQNVLDMLKSVKDVMIESIEIQKDKNLEIDPYFYKRQKELHQLREDIQSGKMEMISQDEWEIEMQNLDKELDLLYANQ